MTLYLFLIVIVSILTVWIITMATRGNIVFYLVVAAVTLLLVRFVSMVAQVLVYAVDFIHHACPTA